MKKFLTVLLSGVLLAATVFGAAGCNKDNAQDDIDPGKSQLYIGAYNGGYGDEWMFDLKERFEEKYKDYSFEDGKTGVQVRINTSGATYVGENILNNINNLNTEVIFTQESNYHAFALAGKVHDITDMVKENLNEKFGEDATILSKIPAEIEEYINVDGKYYGLPHLESYYGIHYNVDLFEEKLWYFSANPNNGNNGFIKNLSEQRSAGPNGVFDYDPAQPDKITDDGLPATYDEFYKLCDRIKSGNEFTPLTWAGNAVQYVNLAAISFLADELGVENNKRLYGTEGPAEDVVIDGDLNNVQDINLTYHDGYKALQFEGLYKVLGFFEKIIDNEYYLVDENLDSSYTNLRAQRDFVLANRANNENQPAMLIEGTYWESEAASAFKTLETYGSSKYEARYAFMPYPKSSADKKGNVVMSVTPGYCYINGNIAPEKVELAETFLQFVYTNESLAEFTRITGATKGVNYTLTPEQYDAMSYWEKSVWTYRENGIKAYSLSTSPLYINQSNRFRHYLNLESYYNNANYPEIMKAFDAGASAEDVFLSIGSLKGASWWEQTFGSILETL